MYISFSGKVHRTETRAVRIPALISATGPNHQFSQFRSEDQTKVSFLWCFQRVTAFCQYDCGITHNVANLEVEPRSLKLAAD